MMLALLIGTVVLLGSLARLGRLRETHHGYYGIALALLGAALDWRWLEILGHVLTHDDALQHAVQIWRPAFVSPLHWLYGKTLWRLGIVQRLNLWLDERL